MRTLHLGVWVVGGLLTLTTGACSQTTQAESKPEQPAARSGLRAALEELDTSTEAGRRAAYERLKLEYEEMRARLEGAAQEAKVQVMEQRDKGLSELVALCDGLERRLDELEESGGERWAKLRADALEHAERLRLECQRRLDEKR